MEDNTVRCFVIADDYRWHVLTDSPEEFHQATLAYLKLMNESSKENHYYFKNIFMSRSEYLHTLKLMAQSKPPKSPRKDCHLHLVT